jgi:hypothetical protein
MEETKAPDAGLSEEWADIPWRKLEKHLYRLQKRIFKASNEASITNDRITEEPCDAKVSSTVLQPSGGGDPCA